MKLVNLIPLKEIDFSSQKAFDKYNKVHKLRPSTKVKIAGKITTAGQAAQRSKDAAVKGTSVFGKDKGGKVFGGNDSKERKLPTNDFSDIKGPKPGDSGWSTEDVFNATFKDPETGKTITVGDAYDREDGSPAYEKAFAYAAEFDPDDEELISGTGSQSKKYDSKQIGDYLNKMSGGNGYAQTNDNGAIEYNMGDGDMPTYTLFIGDDEEEKGKVAVQLSSTYGKDPANLDIYKTFNSKEEAMKYAGMLAKKHKKELEMQDSDVKTSTNIFDKPRDTSYVSDVIKNIADLTDRNDHNGAALALAKLTGDKSYIEQIEKIQRYHDSKGSMSQSLIKHRTAIVNNLLNQARNQYGEKIAKQLDNAF